MKLSGNACLRRSIRASGLALVFMLPLGLVGAPGSGRLWAQAAAPSPATQRGTVKGIDGNVLTVATDGGPTVKVTVPDGTKVQQLAPGSTDIKTASPSQLSDIAVGDRVLAAVRAGTSADDFTAKLIVVMKSSAIAQKNASDQQDWQRNGVGGLVRSVGPDGTISVDSAHRTVTVSTGSNTEFLRFASDSAAYKDSKPGTLAQIQPGDQIQARGTKSADGSSVQATEVVTGSFKNLSGLVASVDPTAGTLTLKDLATKKNFKVEVTPNSNLRRMSSQMAAMVAARGNSSSSGSGSYSGGAQRAQGAAAGQAAQAGGARSADLSQMISRLPTVSMADLKPGDAVMIVASEPAPGSTSVTALTLLTGVESILTANPNGGVDLSGWSMGSTPSE